MVKQGRKAMKCHRMLKVGHIEISGVILMKMDRNYNQIVFLDIYTMKTSTGEKFIIPKERMEGSFTNNSFTPGS